MRKPANFAWLSSPETWWLLPTPLADLAYVVYGSSLHFGIDLDAVLAGSTAPT